MRNGDSIDFSQAIVSQRTITNIVQSIKRQTTKTFKIRYLKNINVIRVYRRS